MPRNKEYVAFLSHKKHNSKKGAITEQLALRVKDNFEDRDRKTFFDGTQNCILVFLSD